MRRHTDIMSGTLLTLVALALLFWIIPNNTSPAQSTNNLSPAFLPTVAALVMAGLAGVLALVATLSDTVEGDAPHEEYGAEARGVGLAEAGDLLVWCMFAAGVMTGFLTIGFLGTAIPALAAMMLFAGQRNWVAIAAVAGALPIAIQQIAWHAFTVTLP